MSFQKFCIYVFLFIVGRKAINFKIAINAKKKSIRASDINAPKKTKNGTLGENDFPNPRKDIFANIIVAEYISRKYFISLGAFFPNFLPLNIKNDKNRETAKNMNPKALQISTDDIIYPLYDVIILMLLLLLFIYFVNFSTLSMIRPCNDKISDIQLCLKNVGI